MSNFGSFVYKISEVYQHPNADRLDIVKIKGYTCIANKKDDGSSRYKKDDLIVYVCCDSVLPEWLLKKMGFWNEEKQCGMLAGSKGNRVKALKLRDVYSEGILYPVFKFMNDNYFIHTSTKTDTENYDDTEHPVKEGQDVAEYLGITKYEPEIPSSMAGEMFNAGTDIFPKYDIEAIQKYMNVFEDGEEVEFTEKLHGTLCMITHAWDKYHNETPIDDWYAHYFVSSKGLGAKGLAFKFNQSNVDQNLYMQTIVTEDIPSKISINAINFIFDIGENCGKQITLFGEIFGKGVQDLQYGQQKKAFRIFDIYYGEPTKGRFLSVDECITFCEKGKFERVPTLYKGPYSFEKVMEYTDGKSSFDDKQIKEGIVIRPLLERRHTELGRVILKSVSQDYKLRKGTVTEFN